MPILQRNTVDGRARDLAGVLSDRRWKVLPKAFGALCRAAASELEGDPPGNDKMAVADLKACQTEAAQFVANQAPGTQTPGAELVGFNPALILLILQLLPEIIKFIEALRKASQEVSN